MLHLSFIGLKVRFMSHSGSSIEEYKRHYILIIPLIDNCLIKLLVISKHMCKHWWALKFKNLYKCKELRTHVSSKCESKIYTFTKWNRNTGGDPLFICLLIPYATGSCMAYCTSVPGFYLCVEILLDCFQFFHGLWFSRSFLLCASWFR